MPLDQLPAEVIVPTRDQLLEDYLRDYRFHDTSGAATNEGTAPWADANVFVDQLLAVWAAVQKGGRNLVLTEAQGDAIETWARIKGLEGRRAATSSTGYVIADTSATGSKVFAEDELVDEAGVRFYCTRTDTYEDEQPIPIAARDTGAGTNLEPGTVLRWSSPRPGCGPRAEVWEGPDGEGLTGGGEEETDEEIIDRIIVAGQNPAASGNDADYTLAAERTPGLSVQKAFAFDGIVGPGTVALCFTMRPDELGASRIPTAAQMALVEHHVRGRFPKDDGLMLCSLVASEVDIVLRVDWRDGADDWEDITPWPPYYTLAGSPSTVVVDSATDATHFVLETQTGAYPGGLAQPKVGNRITFYDAAEATFRRKTIASITGTGPWTIVCDEENDASDLTYTPVAGERVMPWSDSLPAVVPAVQTYMGTLGPGEQLSSFFDEGMRQRRMPRPPDWPLQIGNRLITEVQRLRSVGDATLVEPTVPYVTPVGSMGTFSRLLELRRIAVYPL